MSSNSMDEDEPIDRLPVNNKDYKKTCDDEVNEMVPRLERLCINDELINSPSNNMNTPVFSIDIASTSVNIFKRPSTADSSEKISPIFVKDKSNKIWRNEVTKAAVGKKLSRSRTEKTLRISPTNTQDNNQSQDVNEKASAGRMIHVHPINPKEEIILDITKETKEVEGINLSDDLPLDLSPKTKNDYNKEVKSSSAVTEDRSLMVDPTKLKRLDPETGELTEYSNIISSDISGCDSLEKLLNQYADETAKDIIYVTDSTDVSYLADVSSDDQLHSSGIAIDSLPDTPTIDEVNAALVEDECSGKIAAFVSQVSQMSEVRRRRIGVFNPPSSIIDASKIIISSDEDSKNLRDSPKNYRRKGRKSAKSSPRQIALKHSDINKEEKRPSPCKRKKSSSENMAEKTGKLRRRSLSENNSGTGVKTCLIIRSRSLSPGLESVYSTNSSIKITVQQSRKRANSDTHNASRIKSRRPSSSSDETENKKD